MSVTSSLVFEHDDEARQAGCRACGATDLVAFYEVSSVPTQTCVLLDDVAGAAAYPTGDVLLAFCETCGFIENVRFDDRLVDYSVPTEESQAFSPIFKEFSTWLVEELDERYHLRGRSVLEVGCGKGDFLLQLAATGIRHGLGIDPGFLPERARNEEGEVEFIRDWYGARSTHLTADLVTTRHLMEHVHNVAEFLGWLRVSVSATPGSALFTEVPDAGRVLAEGAYWDVYYEHCSYYTLGSLARALRNSGFAVDWLRKGFQDQYLLAGARLGTSDATSLPAEDTPVEVAAMVQTFAAKAEEGRRLWRERIDEVGEDHVAIWGGASKTIAFLAAHGLSRVTVVDINPYKQGKWLPGVAIEVQSPSILMETRPRLVIPMNPIYTTEITADLARMGLDPVVMAV
ncbi:MAG: class I SAM-dependent methyltransferase [Actinobacteria bacterium]|nr:class I SAM-dependent methyltransferase [Actinomycetota bacterium]